ncbi:MAG: BON domain-containing protein [Steroidobacteraceae bacterium]|jgi:hyperosmotically inducible protein
MYHLPRKQPVFARLAIVGLAAFAGIAGAATDTRKTAGEAIDDAVVTTRVKAALIGDKTTKARKIDVETEQGIVQLNGFVDTAAEKTQAAKLARGVDGVKEVRNNLDVRPGNGSAGRAVDDSTLTAKVKTALADSPNAKARQVNVETKGGVVQLSGFVDSAEAKAEAARVAGNVQGVQTVENRIDVK